MKAWDIWQNYKVGDEVTAFGLVFTCKQDHRSSMMGNQLADRQLWDTPPIHQEGGKAKLAGYVLLDGQIEELKQVIRRVVARFDYLQTTVYCMREADIAPLRRAVAGEEPKPSPTPSGLEAQAELWRHYHQGNKPTIADEFDTTELRARGYARDAAALGAALGEKVLAATVLSLAQDIAEMRLREKQAVEWLEYYTRNVASVTADKVRAWIARESID